MATNGKDLYHVTENGRDQGPYTAQQLKELARKGKLQPSTMIRKEGQSQWVPASSVKGLLARASLATKAPKGPVFVAEEGDEDEPRGGNNLMMVAAVAAVVGLGIIITLVVLSTFGSDGDQPDKDKKPAHPAVVQNPQPNPNPNPNPQPMPLKKEVEEPKPPVEAEAITISGPDLLKRYQADPKKTLQEFKGKKVRLKIEANWQISQLENAIADNVLSIAYFHRDGGVPKDKKREPNEYIQLYFPLVDKDAKLGFFAKIEEYAKQRKKNERVQMSMTGTVTTVTDEKDQVYLALEKAQLD